VAVVLRNDWQSFVILVLEKCEVGIYCINHLKYNIHIVITEYVGMKIDFNIIQYVCMWNITVTDLDMQCESVKTVKCSAKFWNNILL
jgi:hypothetical protein